MLKSMLVDSHCHLNFPDFKDDLEAVIIRAKQAGVGVMQTICTDLAEFPDILAIAEGHEGMYCSIGVHPNEEETIIKAQDLIVHTSHSKVIGIGETGLDYFREHNRDVQVKNFIEHIVASQETGLPLIVHTREADGDTVNILTDYMNKKPFTGLIHCFTATPYLAEAVLEMGMYISLSGIFTFKSAAHLHDIAKTIPLERLLVETDAPYLAPIPYRGKRNEPSYVVHTAQTLADIKGISLEACAQATTDNFFRLFTKACAPQDVNL